MTEKPTYEELEQMVHELEQEKVWRMQEQKRYQFQRNFVIGLSKKTTLKETVDEILTNIFKLDEFDSGGIYLINEKTGGIEFIAHQGLPEMFVEKVKNYDSDDIRLQMILKGDPICQVASECPAPIRKNLEMFGMLSMVAIPIKYGENVIGSVNLVSHTHDVISDESMRILGAITEVEIGTAIFRALAEEALRESNAKFSKAFRSNTSIMALSTLEDGRFIDANNAFLNTLGFERDEVIGKTSGELQLFADIKQRDAVKQIVSEKRSVENYELMYRTKNGELRYGLFSGSTIHLQNQTCWLTVMHDITEHKRSIAEITRISQALEATMDSVVITDLDGKVTYVNEAMLNLHKITDAQSIMGKPILDTVVPELRETVASELQRLPEIGKINAEYAIITEDGKRVPVEASVSVMKSTDGKAIGLAGIVRDISERKRAEDEQRAHMLFLENLDKIDRVIAQSTDLEKMMDDVLDEVLSIFDCDRAWLLYPCDPDASAWRVPMEKTKPEYPGANEINEEYAMTPDVAEGFRDVLATKEPIIAELKPKEPGWDPEDKYGVRSVIALAIHPKSGKPWEFGLHQCSHARIWTQSEQRLFKEISQRINDGLSSLLFFRDLIESREKYHKLFSTSADSIMVIDAETAMVLDVNKACEDKYGYSKKEFQNLSLADVSAEPELSVKAIAPTIKGELTKIPFRYHKKKDGTVFPVELTVGSFTFKGRDVAFGFIRDISERLSMEEEKHRLQDQLQQVQKMEAIGTLAGGIAHDFNNILSIILGNTELAIDDVPEWNPARHNLEEITQASLRAKDIVQQLLSFTRKSDQKQKPIEISPVIKECLKFIRSTTPANIEIIRTVYDESGIISADPTQIHQVMINLCTNAAHAMSENGGVMGVGLSCIEINKGEAIKDIELNQGRYVKITVSDTGHGIVEEHLSRIFDPYFTTKEVGKGSGIGLSVVHGIVKNHNGAISIDSEYGKGTTFNLFFPVAEKDAASRKENDTAISTGNERILFVDDEQAIANVTSQILERLGYTVTTRTSSVDTLETFKARPDSFDLIISDMTMPEITGDKLARQLKQIRPDIPIILCTGFSDRIDDEKAKSIGVTALVMKPIVKSVLAKAIREILD